MIQIKQNSNSEQEFSLSAKYSGASSVGYASWKLSGKLFYINDLFIGTGTISDILFKKSVDEHLLPGDVPASAVKKSILEHSYLNSKLILGQYDKNSSFLLQVTEYDNSSLLHLFNSNPLKDRSNTALTYNQPIKIPALMTMAMHKSIAELVNLKDKSDVPRYHTNLLGNLSYLFIDKRDEDNQGKLKFSLK